MAFNSFYRGKKVLVTGDTGFKGSWLVSWLLQLGADVYGLGLEPQTQPSLFEILQLKERINHTTLDIRNAEKQRKYIDKIKPDVIFHLAAQALVRLSYEIPLETLDTNFMGTANLLHAIEEAKYSTEGPCVLVVITSDKCYENREVDEPYSEIDRMGGHDIYSASKGATELLVSSWRRSFFQSSNGSAPHVLMASCRAGNVIGGGDWSKDRIMVDSIQALVNNKNIRVRNPDSVRPWQHVQEPLSGYLQVGAELGSNLNDWKKYATSWNFGPGSDSEQTVGKLCDRIISSWGTGSWEHLSQENAAHEAKLLRLSVDKAKKHLEWQGVWDFEKTIEETVLWYKLAYESNYGHKVMFDKTQSQIEEYTNDAVLKSLRWTN